MIAPTGAFASMGVTGGGDMGGGGGVGVWCWLPHVLVLCNNTGTRETTNIQVVTQGRSHNS